MENKQKTVDVQAFIKSAGVDAVLIKLKEDMALQASATSRKFRVSDVEDAEGNQYVDLVQEGGGVWGVALLGYTYILEEMGIRFFSLAGTSAGAINTMLLAAIGNKDEAKTKTVIKVLLQLEMFSFVDGKPSNWAFTKWVKKSIQHFVLKAGYVKRIILSLAITAGLFTVVSLGAFITTIFYWTKLVQLFAVIALVCWVVVILLILFIIYRFKTLAKTGYGLNEGSVFLNWFTTILNQHGIVNLTDLKNHFSKIPDTLQVLQDPIRDALMKEGTAVPPGNPTLTIITSEITTGNKIEFPRMWDMYWENTSQVNPGDFVRASMSIPVFFETYKIPVLCRDTNSKKTWKNHINWNGDIPEYVQFVDGGVLSNFPINVFYNAKYIIPRMPTFGIRLGGTNIPVARNIKSVGGYLSALFSTIRSNTDKDFINRNKSFDLGIAVVDMRKHSWLNFFMKDEEKQQMFYKGAAAAADFLRKFDWVDYKKQRQQNNQVLEEQKADPNNW